MVVAPAAITVALSAPASQKRRESFIRHPFFLAGWQDRPMFFAPGHILHWRFHFGSTLSSVVPVRVVEHNAAGLTIWLAKGSPILDIELPDGAHLRDLPPESRPPAGYPLKPSVWPQGSALIHQPSEGAYAVWWLFATGPFSRKPKFKAWYVNLERRVYHDDVIDVFDHELDLYVHADRSWTWKDEESFAEKTGHPAYWSAEEAADIRAAGEEVAALAKAAAFPFDGTWCDFSPPGHWGQPTLP
jgi:hypothetical protein